jgi:60 kDa SS-A/Ro ribonucleoprotein
MLGRLPKANAVNEAGGVAYKLEPKHALAQVAATGTFGNAFYSTAETQLDEVLKLIDEVDDNQYLAKLALYAREKAFMKDMPAALLVALSVRDTELMHRVFDRVVDNGRVLRTVFQMIRSGQFKNKARKGRVGLSSSVQRAFQRWLNTASVSPQIVSKQPRLPQPAGSFLTPRSCCLNPPCDHCLPTATTTSPPLHVRAASESCPAGEAAP